MDREKHAAPRLADPAGRRARFDAVSNPLPLWLTRHAGSQRDVSGGDGPIEPLYELASRTVELPRALVPGFIATFRLSEKAGCWNAAAPSTRGL